MKKPAFSLLELMLVVVIVGIVYTLALSTMKASKKTDADAFTLKTLPKYLRENFKLSDVKILCFEPCGKCQVIVDDEPLEEEIMLFENADVKSYELSFEGYATQKEYLPYDKDDPYKQACFVLHKRVNDSIESVVLELDKEFIYYKAGYNKAEVYESLVSLQDAYKKELDEIRDNY